MLRDFKFIFKKPVLLVSLLVVATLPILYATIFLGAMWNPYENTEEMKFNIVNEDKGHDDINVGESLIDELKDEDRLDWQFTDLDTAKKALQKGDTYGYIIIPEDASENAMSYLTDDPEQVEMSLHLNPGHNFVGSLMAEQAGQSIIGEVNKEITDNYITAIVDQLDSVENNSKEAQDAIKQLTDGANELNDGLVQAEESSGELNSGANELAKGTGTLHQGEQQMTAQIGQIAPNFGPQGQQLLQAQSQLEQGAKQANDGANQLSQGIGQLNGGLGELQNGSQELANALNEVNTQFEEVLNKLDEENISFTEQGANNIAQPINLEINELVNIQNYGQSFAPLILSISLFIGSIAFNVVYPNNKIFEEKTSTFKAFISRMLLYITHAFVISTLIVFFIDFVMQIDVSSHWRFYLLSFVWALLSILVIGALVTLFGNFGKLLSIILLILQLSASGGTFPIETTNAIYQKFYELLPMSYTVTGYRAAIYNQAFDYEFSTVIYLLLGIILVIMLFILLLFYVKDQFPKYKKFVNELSKLES